MLNVVSENEAKTIISRLAENYSISVHTVNINESLGRVLSSDITAGENVPAFDRSTVDGFAVYAADTFGSGESIPAELECIGKINMGQTADFEIKRGQCAEISTGGMLPKGADSVVMVENTFKNPETCLIYSSVSPGENVNLTGSDIKCGSIGLNRGTMITPASAGILAALGVYNVPVFRKPVIAVISTGDEIVTGKPDGAQIRDINTYLLNSLIINAGCGVYVYGAVKDDRKLIEKAVKDCLQKADVVLLSGGSSAGKMDMTAQILGDLGTVHFHGIAVKPGKPTVFADVNGKAVFGLPGHPLAAYFVFRLFVKEYIRVLMDMPEEKPVKKAVLLKNIPSNHGRQEYICVKSDNDGTVLPLYTKSGIISVLRDADGFIRIPRDAEGLDIGAEVEIYNI